MLIEGWFHSVGDELPDIGNLTNTVKSRLLWLYHRFGKSGGGPANLALDRVFRLGQHFLKQIEVFPWVHVVGVAGKGNEVLTQRVELQLRQLLLVRLCRDGKKIQLTFLVKGLHVVVLDDFPDPRKNGREKIWIHLQRF